VGCGLWAVACHYELTWPGRRRGFFSHWSGLYINVATLGDTFSWPSLFLKGEGGFSWPFPFPLMALVASVDSILAGL